MGITSIHIVIANDEGLRALKHFFDRRTVKEPSSVMTTPSSRTSANTQLLFIRWQLLQTNQWRGHGC